MNLVLNLEIQRLRLGTEVGPDHTEDRIQLEGKLKCIEHDISLGGVQPLSEAAGTLQLLDAGQAPPLEYDSSTSVGRLFVTEEYGEWQITAVVVFAPERFRELWERLKVDKSLRSARLLVGDGQEEAAPPLVRFNPKDRFQVEAVEVEFLQEF